VCVRSLSSVELCGVLSLGRWPGVFTVSPLALICWTHVNALVGGGWTQNSYAGKKQHPKVGDTVSVLMGSAKPAKKRKPRKPRKSD